MNERIRELNLQAMSIVMNGSDPDGDVEQMYIPSEFTKKFAELIVRDCTRICAKQAWESRTNDDWTEYNALSRVAGQIKQHFGVEE